MSHATDPQPGRPTPRHSSGLDPPRSLPDVLLASVPGVELRFAALTDVGRLRQLNEDSLLAQYPVFVVADGMGGHAAGELASAIAIEELTALVPDRAGEPRPGEARLDADAVRRRLEAARGRIEQIDREYGDRAAGTTVSGVVVVEWDSRPSWLVVNLGDSRTYRMVSDQFVRAPRPKRAARETPGGTQPVPAGLGGADGPQGSGSRKARGILEQLSRDHTEVQEMVDAGRLTRAQAACHPRRHVVTRALGAGVQARADFEIVPIDDGDRVLICTDGLSGEVPDQEIGVRLMVSPDPARAVRSLVDAALERGGRDNVSAIVVDARLKVSR